MKKYTLVALGLLSLGALACKAKQVAQVPTAETVTPAETTALPEQTPAPTTGN